MKADTYVTIQGWMVSELGLSGSRLMAYAVIHGFSQDGESWYRGGWRYIAEWIGCTENTARKVLADLVDDGFVERRDGECGGPCEYRTAASGDACTPPKNWEDPSQNLGYPPPKNWDTPLPKIGRDPSQKLGGLYIEEIKGEYKGEIKGEEKEKTPKGVKEKSARFSPPTAEQVAAYAAERGYSLDAQRFVDYHQARGWRLKGGIPMKDWKAAVRTWARNGRSQATGGRVRDEFAVFDR